METTRALIVMAKEPVAGSTKTRLTPTLSNQQAADLYCCLLLDTLDTVREVAARLPLAPVVAYTPQTAVGFFREHAPDFDLLPQYGDSLGDRLDTVMGGLAERGFEQVAAINSDSPGLPAANLIQAFGELDDPAVDVVFGPCDDGGYYLIGWKRPYPRLVREVEMSTPHVLSDTVALAQTADLNVKLLPAWYDVDTAADLARMRAAGHGGEHTKRFLAG
jgi:rSAM/selenodomain-associated transferase 1